MSVNPADLEILAWPEPVLSQVASEVDPTDETVQQVAARMIELMHDAEGVGLAAPQVGLPWRLFVTRDPDDRDDPGGMVFINPRIEVLDPELVEDIEGCLSLPGIDVTVRRPGAVRLSAVGPDGRPLTIERGDHFARVFQHEYDHLDGVLIIDRMSTMERIRNRRAIRDLKRA